MLLALIIFLVIIGIIYLYFHISDKGGFLGSFIICGIIFLAAVYFMFAGDDEVRVVGFIFAFFGIVGIIRMLFKGRCPSCKKLFKVHEIGDELISQGDIYYKVENNSRVAYQKNMYRADYACKHCQHEWSKKYFKKEKVDEL